MKKILLLMALLLCVSGMCAQTIGKLMEKYKAFPGAKYENTTEESRQSIVEGKEKGANGISPEDYDYILKHFKMSEQVQLEQQENLDEELDKDIAMLKGYEMLLVQNDNHEAEESGHVIQDMVNEMFNTQYRLCVYGRLKGEVVSGILIRWNMWNIVILSHIEGKWKKDVMVKSLLDGDGIQVEVEAEDEEEKEMVDMADVTKDVKRGDVLFVIDGREYPELRTINEAREYMETIDFHFNQESWVVGEAVKEKYPHTDRKVVIEWSRKEKEEQK